MPPSLPSPPLATPSPETASPEPTPASATLAVASPVDEPKRLTPAARTKLILQQSMAARREKETKAVTKAVKASVPPREPVATPARSDKPAPDVEVMEQKSGSPRPVVGSEAEVEAIAGQLGGDDDDDTATQHYPGECEWTYDSADERSADELEGDAGNDDDDSEIASLVRWNAKVAAEAEASKDDGDSEDCEPVEDHPVA